MPSSLLTRLQRKDVLFQAFSDLVRHNGSCNHNNNNTRYRHQPRPLIITNQRLTSGLFVSTVKSLTSSRLLSGNISSTWRFDHCQALSTDVNNASTTSDRVNDNELIEFTQLSPHDKRIVAKRLGLKAAFLQEINLQTSNDLSTLYFDYCYFSNDTDHHEELGSVKSCLVRYEKFDQLRLDSGVTNLKESLPSKLADPSFMFYPVNQRLRERWLNDDHNEEGEQEEEALVIVENPLDALAVAQQTQLPTVVLRLISSSSSSTDQLPQTTRLKHFCGQLNGHFKKIYFWSNDDQHCERFRTLCLENFDRSKLFMVYSDSPALQMLHRDGVKQRFGTLLAEAVCANHPSIVTFGDLKNEIFKELTDFTVNGVQWARFPKLNEHLKGHRSGELTIVTGPTGCGKTTFVSEYSLDLCMQGVPTLWGSFEIKNVRLAKMMLTQFARQSLVSTARDEFEAHSAKFAKLPLYFMRFHGQTEVDLVLQSARHAVSTLGVRHVIIDNLQFLLGLTTDSNFDRFLKQDHLIGSLRQFSTEHNCHITLVAHPRKEKEEMSLSNNSLYGGIKASQEADNVMIIVPKFHSRFRCHKYVQITKNRYNGALGVVPLYYDKNTLCFSSTMLQQSQQQQQQSRSMVIGDSCNADSTSNLFDEESDLISKKDVKDVPDLYEIRYLYNNQ